MTHGDHDKELKTAERRHPRLRPRLHVQHAQRQPRHVRLRQGAEEDRRLTGRGTIVGMAPIRAIVKTLEIWRLYEQV